MQPCENCNGTIPDGRRSRWCSEKCRNRAKYLKYNAKPKQTVICICVVCSHSFPHIKLVKYCSEKCRASANYAKKKATPESWANYLDRCRGYYTPERGRAVYEGSERFATATRRVVISSCTVDGCDSPHAAKGFCRRHYRAMKRAENVDWYVHGNERERCRRGGGVFGKVNRAAVYERDGWVCGICGLAVDPSAGKDDPMKVSLDHVTPLSKGGDHLPDNCQCSHLRCNIRKQDKEASSHDRTSSPETGARV
jgi:predicted nucleic acid-binding Zn ribbon protein